MTALLVSTSVAGLLAACSGAQTTAPAPSASASMGVAAVSTIDPCEGDEPPPKSFTGPLRGVRCKQEMFLRMAGIADDLGVRCGHCHVPKADDPKRFEYHEPTPNKDVASWMSHTFMTGLRRKDGAPMDCGDCHIDKSGKPAAKFLGEPRDTAWAVEWMTTVMTNRFVLPDGSKLKCKHCHVGTWGTKDFEPKVIGRTDQVPHGPLPVDAPAAPEVFAPETELPPASSADPAMTPPPPQ